MTQPSSKRLLTEAHAAATYAAAGTTAQRPSAVSPGAQFYDTTLGKPIWYSGSAWKDAAGTTV